MVHINTKRAGGEYDVEGLSLAGTPVVLLGYNEAVAWGLTTHGFDVTDSYLETITEVADGPDTVLYKGAQIPIQTVTENIESSDGTSMDVVFEYIEPADAVGGPRYIIPETRTPTSAISVKWTGFAPSNELRAFLELATATNVDDVRTAYENFGVGGQNLVAVTRDGDIFWSTQVNLPVRDARAMDYDPATGTGFAPCFVLPGTGEYEWIDMLSDQFLPHDQNPAKGFIATANNDGVGSISDGNPFDDDHYIGWNFNDGDRFARITERLEELTSGAETVTPEDMSAVQNDAVSPYGRLYTPAFIAELDRAIEEAATPGTHPDLETVVAAIAAADMAKIEDMRDRLAAWTSFDTPAAVEGAPTAQEIADSVATTIFNAAFGRILGLALSDEYEALDSWNGFRSRTFANMLLEPDGMVTYDATLRDGAGDSVLWDDITTAEIESRGQRILAGFVAALDYLETDVDADPNEWRWGRLHTLRLRTTVPQLGGDALSIPLPTDPMFPDGFPRHGDNGVVDASSYGIGDTTDFSYGSGPQQRLVVEMTPERPLIWNAIPGGQSIDPDSPHHADEIELWRTNQAPPMNWTEEEVLAAHERRIVFSP
jgi:penicillin amidase